jgi:hypothetical protein
MSSQKVTIFAATLCLLLATVLHLILAQAATTRSTGASKIFDKPFYNVSAMGKEITVINNVNQSYCNTICVGMKDLCILSQWTHTNYQQYYMTWRNNLLDEGIGECKLFSRVWSFSRLSFSQSTIISQFLNQVVTYSCTRQVNRFYFDLVWSRLDNVTTQDACEGKCMLTNGCQVWAFDVLRSFCFSSSTTYSHSNASAYTVFNNMNSGNCSFDNKNFNIY